MTHKFDKDVVEDNLSQGMGGLPAAEAMGCEITTHTCGITLIIGKGEGTIAGHSWWGLGNNHNITVNADKILGDLSEGNECTITINMDPTSQTFSPNSRVTPWLNGQAALNNGNHFLVQDGTEEMRKEVRSKAWSFRMAIECEGATTGCKVSLQSLPMGPSEIRQMVDQAASSLCVTRLARTRIEWLPPPLGYDHTGPWPLFYDARSMAAQNADRLPTDKVIRTYVRDTCVTATPFPSMSRQECQALAAGELLSPPSRTPAVVIWPDIPSTSPAKPPTKGSPPSSPFHGFPSMEDEVLPPPPKKVKIRAKGGTAPPPTPPRAASSPPAKATIVPSEDDIREAGTSAGTPSCPRHHTAPTQQPDRDRQLQGECQQGFPPWGGRVCFHTLKKKFPPHLGFKTAIPHPSRLFTPHP